MNQKNRSGDLSVAEQPAGAEHIHNSIPPAMLMHVHKHPKDAPDWDLSKLQELAASKGNS